MQTHRLAAATFAITSTFGVAVTASESRPRPAARSSECSTAARGSFKSEAALQTIAERLEDCANRTSTDEACHNILAAKLNGSEIKFSGADLRMVSRDEAMAERLPAVLP